MQALRSAVVVFVVWLGVGLLLGLAFPGPTMATLGPLVGLLAGVGLAFWDTQRRRPTASRALVTEPSVAATPVAPRQPTSLGLLAPSRLSATQGWLTICLLGVIAIALVAPRVGDFVQGVIITCPLGIGTNVVPAHTARTGQQWGVLLGPEVHVPAATYCYGVPVN